MCLDVSEVVIVVISRLEYCLAPDIVPHIRGSRRGLKLGGLGLDVLNLSMYLRGQGKVKGLMERRDTQEILD